MSSETDFPPPAVDIKKLRAHFESLQLGTIDSTSLDLEFENLEKKSASYPEEYDSAKSEDNRTKNRYANVLPHERTRVKLSGDQDYINANYISFDGKKTYIAAQGPLKATTEDFWTMIWEDKCEIVVMLTKLKENGRNKCHQYWPNKDKPDNIGDFKITFLNQETGDNALIRRDLVVKKIPTGESRIIHHFQYVEWPDHGLPISTEKFREMLHKVDEIHKNGPILVHCSAGIGRTGTFCAVHSTIHRLRNGTTNVNLPELILQLRSERAGMVQTRDQYEFCYMAILEEIEENYKNILETV